MLRSTDAFLDTLLSILTCGIGFVDSMGVGEDPSLEFGAEAIAWGALGLFFGILAMAVGALIRAFARD